jgi:hypothetical protein
MVDSHLNAIDDEIKPKIRRIIDPETVARKPPNYPGTSLHLVAVAQNCGLRARGLSKRNRP